MTKSTWQPDLSFEENKAILDALTYRHTEPQMATAMLRRTWLLSVGGSTGKTRAEMLKYAVSLLKVYPTAFQPEMIREGHEVWEKSMRTDEDTFINTLGVFLAPLQQNTDEASGTFASLFRLASSCEEMGDVKKIYLFHLEKHPTVKWQETVLADLCKVRDDGWSDKIRGIYGLFHARQLFEGFPVALEALRDLALVGQRQEDYRLVNESTLLLKSMAVEMPQLFTQQVIGQMIGNLRVTPLDFDFKARRLVETLGLLHMRDVFSLDVEHFLLHALVDSNHLTDNLMAKYVLRRFMVRDPAYVQSVSRRALGIMRKPGFVPVPKRLCAIKALDLVGDFQKDAPDAAIISALVSAGCQDDNMDVREAARDTLAGIMPFFHGDRRSFMNQAVSAGLQAGTGNAHDEDVRRVMTILTMNRLDDADNAIFNMKWDSFRNNFARLKPEERVEDCKILVNASVELGKSLLKSPGLASLPFYKELWALQASVRGGVMGLCLRGLHDQVCWMRPDLPVAMVPQKPVCKPRLS